MNEQKEITFNYNGIDYTKKGRVFFEFDRNCYGMNYDAVAFFNSGIH